MHDCLLCGQYEGNLQSEEKWNFVAVTATIWAIDGHEDKMSKQISFYNDYNIIKVNMDFNKELEGYVANKDTCEEEYQRYKKIIEKSHNPLDVNCASRICKRMEKILPKTRDGTLVNEYRRKVSSYLVKYNELCGTSRVFGMDNCRSIPERVATIIGFLKVASEFVNIEWSCSYNMSDVCPRCYKSLKKQSPLMICTNCSFSRNIVKVPNVHVEDGKIKPRSTYKAPKNFRKEYMHVCGTINGVKDDEESDIRSYLYRAGISEANATREDIRTAIHACNYNNYNDTSYLYSLITKNPLPDIMEHIEVCTERFEKYFEVFHSIDKEGNNITNIHFLIKLFLWQEEVPYEDDWFRSLSPHTEGRHKRNAKRCLEILKQQDPDRNWDWPSEWDTAGEQI